MSQENIKVVERLYEAWQRDGFRVVAELMTSDVEWVNPAYAVEPGTHDGDMKRLRAFYDDDAITRLPEGWPEPGPFLGWTPSCASGSETARHGAPTRSQSETSAKRGSRCRKTHLDRHWACARNEFGVHGHLHVPRGQSLRPGVPLGPR
jgi:hypothetical protein